MDVLPAKCPVLVSGGFLEGRASGPLFSLGEGESLGVGGRLALGPLSGATEVPPRTWHHVALVRDRALSGEEIGRRVAAAAFRP